MSLATNADRVPVSWVVEPGVFSVPCAAMETAIRGAGHQVVQWQDDWWTTGRWPRLENEAVIFHGSLGNAARMKTETTWQPGAYCDTAAFTCSTWYARARPWLLHRAWQILPANELAADPVAALKRLDCAGEVFVRPNSPLKPFAGRVLPRNRITLAALDHGFYYDDPTILVVVAPVRKVSREWRYVVVDQRVVAGSAYASDSRVATADDPGGQPWAFASDIAARLDPPEQVYVMDVCESDGSLWLLELNPFSGADLYACALDAVVRAVSGAARRQIASLDAGI